jgi:hypothetical protein
LTVGGVPYSYPENSELGWGENATDWAAAVTSQLNTLTVTGDITLTSFNLANNQVSMADIVGLSFDIGTILMGIIEYDINRSTDSFNYSEGGFLLAVYNPIALTWQWNKYKAGTSGPTVDGVQFNVTSSGQVQYTSDNISGTNYTGQIKFRARVLK